MVLLGDRLGSSLPFHLLYAVLEVFFQIETRTLISLTVVLIVLWFLCVDIRDAMIYHKLYCYKPVLTYQCEVKAHITMSNITISVHHGLLVSRYITPILGLRLKYCPLIAHCLDSNLYCTLNGFLGALNHLLSAVSKVPYFNAAPLIAAVP